MPMSRYRPKANLRLTPACSLRRLRRQLPPGGSCGVPPLSFSHGNLQQIVTAPPVPGIVTLQRGSSIPPSRRELFFVGLCVFALGFGNLKVPAVNLQEKQRFLPAPTGRGGLGGEALYSMYIKTPSRKSGGGKCYGVWITAEGQRQPEPCRRRCRCTSRSS